MRIFFCVRDAMQVDARNIAHPNDQVFAQQLDGFNGVGEPDFVLRITCNQDAAQGLVGQADNMVNDSGHNRAMLCAVGELFLGTAFEPCNNFVDLYFFKVGRIFAIFQYGLKRE